MLKDLNHEYVPGMRAGTLSVALVLLASGCHLYFGEPEPAPIDPIVIPPEPGPTDPATCLENLEPGDIGPMFPLDLGPTVKAENAPPPVSGGTMALSPDESVLVASDPDRDQVYLVPMASPSTFVTVALEAGDEPGRVVVDDSNRAHVVLRSGGGVVAIDLVENTILGRRETCASPRGIDFDGLTGNLYVACHSGKLLTMEPATGALLDEIFIETGLRDVIATSEHLYVSKFRTAELFVLSRSGERLTTMLPPSMEAITFNPMTGEEALSPFEPSVAWRIIKNPDGGVVMFHQRSRADQVKPTGGGYGGDLCQGGALHSAVTPMEYNQETPVTAALGFVVLPVDGTLIRDNQQALVVAAGNLNNEFGLTAPGVTTEVPSQHRDFDCAFLDIVESFQGQATAAVSLADDTVIMQFREPAELRIFPPGNFFNPVVISLDTESRRDTGHDLFHINPGAGVACASCHPEGSDDARVWNFQCIGERRTQPLHFGLLGTEPFHWDGDMDDFTMLMSEVFAGRMGGERPQLDQIQLMGEWLDTVRAPARDTPADLAAVARGEILFNDMEVGCAGCHAGPKLISEGWFDVGTGGSFQVPSLVGIADRKPFMHTGCANTLRERFTNRACGGGDMHGKTSHLSPRELDDLIAFVETL